MTARRRRREVIARGQNAAANLRREIRANLRKDIWPECAQCKGEFLPSQIDIDHITPLSKGGEDVADNVQLLCKGCHKVKTALDMGYVPF